MKPMTIEELTGLDGPIPPIPKGMGPHKWSDQIPEITISIDYTIDSFDTIAEKVGNAFAVIDLMGKGGSGV